jgi:hypothetical protein
MMLAHGFSIGMMVELVDAGLATATDERMVAGNFQALNRSGSSADNRRANSRLTKRAK